MKVLIFCAIISLSASVCIENGYNTLSCYSQTFFEEPWMHIENLKLYDSILTLADAQFVFPNLKNVFVYGDYTELTCSELYGLYNLHGCLDMTTFTVQTTDDFTTSGATTDQTNTPCTTEQTNEPSTTELVSTSEQTSEPSTIEPNSTPVMTTDESLSTSSDVTTKTFTTTGSYTTTPGHDQHHSTALSPIYIVIIILCSVLTVAIVIVALVKYARRNHYAALPDTSLYASDDSNELENTPAIPLSRDIIQMDPLPLPSAPTASPQDSGIQVSNKQRKKPRAQKERVRITSNPSAQAAQATPVPPSPIKHSTPVRAIVHFFKTSDSSGSEETILDRTVVAHPDKQQAETCTQQDDSQGEATEVTNEPSASNMKPCADTTAQDISQNEASLDRSDSDISNISTLAHRGDDMERDVIDGTQKRSVKPPNRYGDWV